MAEERLEQGRAYVAGLRTKGSSDEQIREKMRTGGWPDELIERVMGVAEPVAEEGWALEGADPDDTTDDAKQEQPPDEFSTQWSGREQEKPQHSDGKPTSSLAKALADRERLAKHRVDPIPRPRNLTILVAIMAIGSFLGSIAAIVLVWAARAATNTPTETMEDVVAHMKWEAWYALGIELLVFYAVVLFMCYFLWHGAEWARGAAVLWLGLGMLMTTIRMVLGSTSGAVGIAGLTVATVFIVALNKGDVHTYFNQQ